MKYLAFYIFIALLFGCTQTPDDDSITTVSTTDSSYYLVLNEGLFQANNSSLTYYDPLNETKVIQDYFLLQNKRLLGDTGNDLLRYGSKIYIAMDVSGTVEVISINGKSITQIPFKNGSASKSPRKLLANNGEVLVVNFDGTISRIDTTDFAMLPEIKVGKNPDGIAMNEEYIVVTNSGGLDAPNYDSTITVIDKFTSDVVGTYHVGLNPAVVVTDDEGEFYISYRGDYNTKKGGVCVFSTDSMKVKKQLAIEANDIAISQQQAYISSYNFNSAQSQLIVFDTKTDTIIKNNILPKNTVETIYGIQTFENDPFLYCYDANGFTTEGEVIVIDKNGVFQTRFDTGINPGSMIKVNKNK